MPHIVVKMFPGRTPEQKTVLAEALAKTLMDTLNSPESAVSVAIEDVAKDAWMDQVAKPEIAGKADTVFKQPGYKIG